MNKNIPLAAFLILTVGAAWANDHDLYDELGTVDQCPKDSLFGTPPAAKPGTPQDTINHDFKAVCDKKKSGVPSFMSPAPRPVLNGGIDGGVVAADDATRVKAQIEMATIRVNRVKNPWGDKPDAAASPNGGASLFSPHVTLQSEGFKKVPIDALVVIPSRFIAPHPVPAPSAADAQSTQTGSWMDQYCKKTDGGRVQCSLPSNAPSR